MVRAVSQAAARQGARVVRSITSLGRGVSGERAVGQLLNLAKNSAARIPSLGRLRRFHIPDFYAPGSAIHEVKNVARLAYTQQLRSFAAFARTEGIEFVLWVRSDTVLSRGLLEAWESGEVVIGIIP
jgi:hypothetical protein